MLYLRKFKEDDIDSLIPMMKRAFDYDSMMHLHHDGGPQGYDNGDFFRKWFLSKKATPYTIYEEDKIIGAVNLWINQNNENYLGCLFIDDTFENKGLGTHVWKHIEELYPNTIVWRTETPAFSHRNHNFYINKCGFKCVHISNPKDIEESSFLLEKVMK